MGGFLEGFAVLLRKELREQWRTSRLPVVALIFFVFGLLSPLAAYYAPEIVKKAGGDIQVTLPTPTVKDAVAQFLSNLDPLGPFAANLLGMGEVARERERGTAAFVLTKPVTRSAFLLAKFVALMATLGFSVLMYTIAAYFYTTVLFTNLPVGGFVASAALALLAIAVFASLTFLASSIVRSALAAGGIGLAAYILLSILSALPRLGRFTPGGLVDPARTLALGHGVHGLWGPLTANLLLVCFAVVAAWLVFRGQEIEG